MVELTAEIRPDAAAHVVARLRDSLANRGYRIESAASAECMLRGPGLNSSKDDPIRSFSWIRVQHLDGLVRVTAEDHEVDLFVRRTVSTIGGVLVVTLAMTIALVLALARSWRPLPMVVGPVVLLQAAIWIPGLRRMARRLRERASAALDAALAHAIAVPRER
jgi:hypothetical protein